MDVEAAARSEQASRFGGMSKREASQSCARRKSGFREDRVQRMHLLRLPRWGLRGSFLT